MSERIPSDVVWAAVRGMYPWMPPFDRVRRFSAEPVGLTAVVMSMVCPISQEESRGLRERMAAASTLDIVGMWDAARVGMEWMPPAEHVVQDGLTLEWDAVTGHEIWMRVYLRDGFPRTFTWTVEP